MTATSLVPPPMSTIMLPVGSVIGRPAPMAAIIACSTRKTSEAPALIADSRTARFSTGVISEGTPITIRGRARRRPWCALRMKCLSMCSVISKSAITPSFIGRTRNRMPGVRPSISLASVPTASMRLLWLLTTTTDGSRTTMPFA